MNRITAALLTTAALLLTGCTTAPTGTLLEQLQDQDLATTGLRESTIQSAGVTACKARDAGLTHREITYIASDNLGEFYTPGEIETLTNIWYMNLCPEHA